MNISIIIPTINRYSDLKNTIRYLQKQTVKEFELIIIDQTDSSIFEDLSCKDGRIIHLHSEIKSASAARNIGLLEAKSDIVLFLDDDVIINNPFFLSNHLLNYRDEKTSGVFGSVQQINNQTFAEKRHPFSFWKRNGWLFFPTNYKYKAKIRNGGAGNLSVRKAWAIEVGGMDENYQKGAHREESDFCLRYTDKYRLLEYDPECLLIHIGNPLGGIRSWSSNSKMKGQHNYDGAFYFIINILPVYDWPLHFLVTMKYFTYDQGYFKNIKLLLFSSLRILVGIKNAINLKRKGPKLLQCQ